MSVKPVRAFGRLSTRECRSRVQFCWQVLEGSLAWPSPSAAVAGAGRRGFQPGETRHSPSGESTVLQGPNLLGPVPAPPSSPEWDENLVSRSVPIRGTRSTMWGSHSLNIPPGNGLHCTCTGPTAAVARTVLKLLVACSPERRKIVGRRCEMARYRIFCREKRPARIFPYEEQLLSAIRATPINSRNESRKENGKPGRPCSTATVNGCNRVSRQKPSTCRCSPALERVLENQHEEERGYPCPARGEIGCRA